MISISRRSILMLGLISGLSLGGYLVACHFFYRIGFPLDDAWIHQTYARNLALYGEWAYNPGVSSGGSTGPLWSGILAVGYLLRFNPLIWTYIMGWLALWSISVLGTEIFKEITPQGDRNPLWIGILLSLEWHIIWMAGSGMETLLFSMLATMVLGFLLRNHENSNIWGVIGGCIGLSVWLRPDGITLLGPSLVIILIQKSDWQARLRIGAGLLTSFFVFFFPYLAFNQFITGSWWPNTFFAKQAEYIILQNTPFLIRLLEQMILPVIGVGFILLPGFLLKLLETIRKRQMNLLAIFLWLFGYLCIYAWRLPVTYQHGRYVMPMMPISFIIGFSGLTNWVFLEKQNRLRWVLNRTWVGSTVIVLGIFWVLGAQAYVRDVAYIESEMVETAKWLNKNLPDDAIIASHDIGALGYFSDRELIDMAGLITPEVIPFIRDERRLSKYLDEQGADYIVTFPNWYPELILPAEMIYQTDGAIAPSLDHENLAVFRWGESK
jgi:hypothetical protein